MIDNNLIENSIRPLALGRKNYLFAGSHDAAQNTAMMYSFFGSCKKQNIEPFQWLKTTLEKISDHKANKLHELLPDTKRLNLNVLAFLYNFAICSRLDGYIIIIKVLH